MIDDNPVVRSVARAIDGAISRVVQGLEPANWDPHAESERFREVREKTLGILAHLSIAQASWSPGKGKWSIAQIADHLLLSEEMYRDQARRLLQVVDRGQGSSIEITLNEVDFGFAAIPRDMVPLFEVPMRMFNLFVPSALRETMVRYPIVAALTPRTAQPREGLVPARLKLELAASLEETADFLAMPMPHNIDELTINHPIMGNNTIPQLFRILIAHEKRHHEQMERVQAHADFPRISQEPMSAAEMSDVFGSGD